MTEAEKSAVSRIRCSEIMTRDVRTATREMTLQQVAQMMRDGDMGSVPVVEDGRLIGIVTDRDLAVNVVAEGLDPKTTQIGEVMTKGLVTCKENDDVWTALKLMQENQVRRIPVVDDKDHLRGIIAQADVATKFGSERATGKTVEQISD